MSIQPPIPGPVIGITSRFVRFQLPGDVTVVRLLQHVGPDVVEQVVRAPAAWLVIDLREVAPPIQGCAEDLVRALERRRRPLDHTCVVHPRSAPVLGVAAFTSIGDACQAHILQEAGFGRGWASPTADSQAVTEAEAAMPHVAPGG